MDRELIDAATSLINARTDNANHTTAAAARTAAGQVVTGVNVFHFTGGPCAELVVIGRAVGEDAGALVEIVAVGDGGRGILSPCGRCRQVLWDYSLICESSSPLAARRDRCPSPSYSRGETAGTQKKEPSRFRTRADFDPAAGLDMPRINPLHGANVTCDGTSPCSWSDTDELVPVPGHLA